MQLEIAQQSEASQLNSAISNPLVGNSAKDAYCTRADRQDWRIVTPPS